jgi:hypothetical protein
MTLDQVIARLSQNDQISGILIIGSAARSQLTSTSDYDLVLVLSELSVPLHVAITTIDGRLADLLFVTTAQIDEVLALNEPLAQDQWLARIVRWLEAGEIAYDRTGQIARAQAKAKSSDWVRPDTPLDAYGAWFRLNFNLAHTRRIAQSADPASLAAAELRLSLYGPSDLLYGYWEMRGLRWEGEKAAAHYLEAQDPTYLDTYLCFLRQTDLAPKLALYEDLAARTMAPLGAPWSADATAVTLDGGPATPEQIQTGLHLWQALISGQ